MAERYGLYVIRMADIGAKERWFFCAGDPDACLLYTNHKPRKARREIRDLSILGATEKEWLNGCVNRIRLEFLKSHETENLQRGKAFNERFEAELLLEKEKLEAKAESAETSA